MCLRDGEDCIFQGSASPQKLTRALILQLGDSPQNSLFSRSNLFLREEACMIMMERDIDLPTPSGVRPNVFFCFSGSLAAVLPQF